MPRRPCRRRRARNEGRKSSSIPAALPVSRSFCTIINVQGRKSRANADDLEAIVRENYKQGITSFFITDDNMARNKHWEDFFDRLIELKENEGIGCPDHQVDTQCHRIPNFIHKALGRRLPRLHRARERQSRQPAGCQAAPEQDHRIPQDAGVDGRLDLGRLHPRFPWRHARSILRDMESSRFCRSSSSCSYDAAAWLGGPSTLWKKGVWMDPDLNKYDRHRVVHHPKMVTPSTSRPIATPADLLHARAHRDGGAPPRRSAAAPRPSRPSS
jgi:hypothetical protein